MSGLKPFRVIPEDIREWTRWMKAQTIPEETTTTTTTTVVTTVTKYKTSDTVITNDISLPNDPHLSGWSLDGGSYYKLTAFIKVNVANSTEPDFGFNIGTNNTFDDQRGNYTVISDSSVVVQDNLNVTTATTIQMAANAVAGLELTAFVLTDDAANVSFRWSQGTDSNFATTVERGSWMTFEKLGE